MNSNQHNNGHNPVLTPVSALGDLPDVTSNWIDRHQIISCEQLYGLILLRCTTQQAPAAEAAEHEPPASELATIQARLEQILPNSTITHLQAATKVRWTDRHPPGVLPPVRSHQGNEDVDPTINDCSDDAPDAEPRERRPS